jgi:hypothetical protein
MGLGEGKTFFTGRCRAEVIPHPASSLRHLLLLGEGKTILHQSILPGALARRGFA